MLIINLSIENVPRHSKLPHTGEYKIPKKQQFNASPSIEHLNSYLLSLSLSDLTRTTAGLALTTAGLARARAADQSHIVVPNPKHRKCHPNGQRNAQPNGHPVKIAPENKMASQQIHLSLERDLKAGIFLKTERVVGSPGLRALRIKVYIPVFSCLIAVPDLFISRHDNFTWCEGYGHEYFHVYPP